LLNFPRPQQDIRKFEQDRADEAQRKAAAEKERRNIYGGGGDASDDAPTADSKVPAVA